MNGLAARDIVPIFRESGFYFMSKKLLTSVFPCCSTESIQVDPLLLQSVFDVDVFFFFFLSKLPISFACETLSATLSNELQRVASTMSINDAEELMELSH